MGFIFRDKFPSWSTNKIAKHRRGESEDGRGDGHKVPPTLEVDHEQRRNMELSDD